MKRFISLLLCLIMVSGLFPASLAAPVIDSVESAAEYGGDMLTSDDEKTENAAVLASVSSVPADVPMYDVALGQLVYYEDFEDGETGGAYSNGVNAYISSGLSGVVDSPSGSGKVGAGSGTVTAQVAQPTVTHYDSVTVMADLYMPTTKASASGWVRISLNNSYTDWGTYSFTQANNGEKWNTISETVKNVDYRSANNDWVYEISGVNGMYIDNIRVYAKYALTNQIRLVDGDSVQLIDVTGTYILSAPETAGFNAWRADDGKIYTAGSKAPAGVTLVAFEMPSLYDASLGELVYYEDFEDGSASGAYCNGANGYISSGLSGVVDSPSGSGKVGSGSGTVTIQVAQPTVTHYDSVTVMADLYMPASKATASGWVRISLNNNYTDWGTYSFTQANNGEKWNTISETVKNVDYRSANNDWVYEISGTNGMYIDNIRVYAKYALTNQIRIVDGGSVKLIDVTDTYTLPTPETDSINAWRADDGKIYFAGDKVSAGITLVAFEMPSVYDFSYGELVYYEDFEDGATGNAYCNGDNGFISGGVGNVADNPSGNGKVAAGSGIITIEVDNPEITHYDSVTIMADLYMPDTKVSASGWVRISMNYPFWNAYSLNTDNANKWTAISATVSNVDYRSAQNDWVYEISGTSGLYVDNIRVYAKYDIGNNIRLVEGTANIVSITGDTFVFPAPASAKLNGWKDSEGNVYKAGDTISASECAGKTFVAELIRFDEVAKLEISSSAITEDRGTVTVKPVISYVTGETETDFSDVRYITDTANASIERNVDGSLTVTGQINGDITITAVIPDSIKDRMETPVDLLETTISISGQDERIVATTFTVMMFGNSIRRHEPNASLNWTGDWGMAASAEDKDYAHRFIHYMDEKYGEGTSVLYDTESCKAFEDAFANKGENEDYTAVLSSYINAVKETQPDIVTLQFGDNAKNVTSAKAYENGVKQFVNGIKEAAPDAVVVISTPFFNGANQVAGTLSAGEALGVPVAEIHALYTEENLARSEYPAGTLAAGVDIHPGDRGMDNIAKEFFALINPIISESKKIEYTTVPNSVDIADSVYEITSAEGTLVLKASVLPADASQEVVWSLVSENAYNYASISDDGVVTAINNGKVTVRAASRYKEGIYDEVEITITGQTDPFTVTYNGNASDATVPEPNTFAKKGFRLDNVSEFASRPGYKFLGWSLAPDGEVADSLRNAESDTTVYAQWMLADAWDFERTGYAEDFTAKNAFHQKVTDGEFSVTATGTTEENMLTVVSPVLKLNSDDYYSLVIKMQNTEKAADTKLTLALYAGETTYEFTQSVTTTDSTEYYFDLREVTGTITGFELKPTDVDCTVTIDEIRFMKSGDSEYTKKPAEYSDEYGMLVYFDNFSGEDFGNTGAFNVLGVGEDASEISGKKAVSSDSKSLGNAVRAGILLEAQDGVSFKYTDGKEMNGTLSLVYEVFAPSSVRFFSVGSNNPGGWDEWDGMYTKWATAYTTAGAWAKLAVSYSTTGRTKFGYLNTSNIGDSLNYASVSVYYKPSKYVKLIDGETTKLIDLNGLDDFTFPESENEAYKGWKSGNGVPYLTMQSVPVNEVQGKTYTSCEVKTAKITYSGVGYEYVRLDGDSVQYTVRTDNYPEWDMNIDGTFRICGGWTFKENSNTDVDMVEVTEAGITLYPIWNKFGDAVEYEIDASGETAVEIDNVDRTYTYMAELTADKEIPIKTVTWSVSDETVASIDENGVLTPIKSGNIKVIATADYYPFKSSSVDVVITYKENYEPVNVTFEGDLKKLPDDFTIIPGKTVDLAKYLDMEPASDRKRFNGWILNGDSENILSGEIIAVTGTDMHFTAVVNYDFNFAVPQYESRYYNYGTLEVIDGVLVCTANSEGVDTFLNISGLKISTARFSAVEFYMDVKYLEGDTEHSFAEGDSVDEFYFSIPGVANRGPVTGTVTSITKDGKYAVIRYEVAEDSRWTDTVTAIRNDFVGNGHYSYGVRYIRFVEKAQTEETKLTISGITAPVTGYAPDTDVTVAESFAEIESVTWSCGTDGSFLASGNFNENTAYTVTFKVVPASDEYILNEAFCATVNGKEADVEVCDDGTAIVSYTFAATEPFIEFDAYITGTSVINKSGRSYEYKFNVSAELPDNTATWSIDNTDVAEIVADTGKLVGRKNGTVIITAVSDYNPSKSATFTVTFENINEVYYNLSFDSGTQDTNVTGMPENTTVLEGVVKLPENEPSRPGYVFLGWTDEKGSVEPIDKLVVYEDTTLYAIWGSGLIWDFNGTKENFGIDNGTMTVSDNYVIVKTTAAEDVRLYSPAITLDPGRYQKVMIKFAIDNMGFTEVFYSTDGSGIDSSKKKNITHVEDGLDNWQTVTFDFSGTNSWIGADQITKLWIDIFQSVNTTAYIDYIIVLDETRTVTFDAGAGTLPENLAGGITRNLGSTVAVAGEAVLDGHSFLGWSMTPDGSEIVESFVLTDNTTLYAAYGDSIDTGADPTDTVSVGSLTLDSGEVLIVETAANAALTVTYKIAGEEKTWSGNANENGFAVAVLETETELTDVTVTAGSNITEVTVTTAETASSAASKKEVEKESPSSGSSGSSSSSSDAKEYDKTVETITKPGTIFPTGDQNPEDVGSVKADLMKEGTVLFNFDKSYQMNFFDSITALESGAETDSVLNYRVFSKSPSATVYPEMILDSVNIDADEKKYIVIRARQLGLENPNLRIYFTKADATSYTKLRSVRCVLTDEYTTLVYDMTENKYWNGDINSLRFTLERNSAGSVEIDWIMITDEIPEDTSYLNEAKDIFEVTRSEELPFADVAKKAWYYSEVEQSYKRGFVNGKSTESYDPESPVTVAEAITIAVRLNSIYNGTEIPEASAEGNWYDLYVTAAINAKIISGVQFSDYSTPATRREVAMIMAKALPSAYLQPINVFDTIPDLEEGSRGYSQILQLYKAGVLNGSDASYSFLPDTMITRAELAAIVNRLAMPGARKRIYTEAEREADKLVYTGSVLGSCSLWNCTENNLKVDGDGYAWATGKTDDPIALLQTVTGRFDGKDVVRIKLGIKWDKEQIELTPQLYYTTTSSGSFSASKMFTGTVGEQDENGVAEIVFDVKSQSAFADTVTQLRFDPFDAKDISFAITYIIIE